MNNNLRHTEGILTVKQLRDFLAAHEASWTETDKEYLGEFGTQPILSLPANSGYTFSRIECTLGLGGFMIVPVDQEGEVLL